MGDAWVELPLAVGEGESTSPFLSDAELVNLMIEPTPPDSPKPFAIVNTPNYQRIGNTGSGNAKGMVVNGFGTGALIFYALGSSFYYYDGSTVTSIATCNSNYPVRMCAWDANSVLAAGGSAAAQYVTKTTAASITFPAGTPGMFAAQDGYAIAIREGTNEFYLSAIDDPTTWNALDFSAADALPDILVAVYSRNRELVLMGRNHTEFWYNSGAAAFPFVRGSPGVEERGCWGATARHDNDIYFLGTDKRVYRLRGYKSEPVSTPWIESYIKRNPADTGEAVGSIYTLRGQTYYVLSYFSSFSGVDLLVYNITSGLWHRSTPAANNYAMMGAGVFWDGNVYAMMHNGSIQDLCAVGAYNGSAPLYQDSWSGPPDRQITLPPFQARGNAVFESDVEISMALTAAGGTARFDYSDDGGVNYKSHGANTVTSTAATTRDTSLALKRWSRCGRYLRRNHRFVISVNDSVAIDAIRHRFEVGR